jgi:hypothetical protein
MEHQIKDIPQGYMEDAQGRLIPIEKIKPIDLERDALVREIVEAALKLRQHLAEFKLQRLGDIDAFIELSMERYGVKFGGVKGNVQLSTFDGKYKVRRDQAEHLTFDEGVQAAKALIDECINEWAEGSNANLKVIVNDAFKVNQEGKLDIRRILELRRYDIDDPRWNRAMDAIGESLQVVGSSTYLRIYERTDTGRYEQIPLDLANA